MIGFERMDFEPLGRGTLGVTSLEIKIL